VLASSKASFFIIHPKRSLAAFEELIKDWKGILVSDNCGVYQKWVNQWSPCGYFLISRMLNPPMIMLREPCVLE
jgi:hypothetical protein